MAKKEEKQAPQQTVRVRLRIVDTVGRVLNTAIVWGFLFGMSYWAYRSVEVLAGDKTTADIGIRFITSVKISKALAWVLGASGIGYGVAQRKLRRDTIQQLQERIKTLEKKIDPKRTTSGLTVRGETRQEDK